ncbi:MAG: bifunctional precorrin-2 dehydrogenase/sirohydrochlorin ferrochelatase [Huintestinicola sp.]
MGYFPFFIEIKNKKTVIIGGGRIALGKVKKLLPYEPEITVIAPLICDELMKLAGIKITQKPFDDSDINGAFAVIAATDDKELNAHIYLLCTQKNILVNTVDDKEKCGFIFPALISKKDVSIGISTSGKSPLFAKLMREYIEEELDENKLTAFEYMGKYRGYVKSFFKTEEQRKEAFGAIFDMCISCGENAPDDEDIQLMLEKLRSKYDA